MPAAYQWHPIRDLEGDPTEFTDGELISLARVWDAQRKEMAGAGELEEFNKRIHREWAIETGIIENVYTLDRATTRTLIEKGIDAALIRHDATNRDATLVARIIQDHYDTLEVMFDFVGGQRELSAGYVKELHAALLRNQENYSVVDQFGHAFEKPLAKGQYKTDPNSPTRPDGTVHEYCPPEHVPAEMDRLLEMLREHGARHVPPEVEAAWLHHRFTQIHPFADGNGRVARAMASLVFIKAGWFPLIVQREDWKRYVEALELADRDNLGPLVALFVEAQRHALIQATEVAYDIKPPTTTKEVIAAARERLVHRGTLTPKEWLQAKPTAESLAQIARTRLGQVAMELMQEIGGTGKGFQFAVAERFPEDADKRLKAIQQAGQEADLAEYSREAHLLLKTNTSVTFKLSFHALGPRYRGIIGVVAFLQPLREEPIKLEGGTFQINYEEDLASAESRFKPWFEHVIVEGLNEWRGRL